MYCSLYTAFSLGILGSTYIDPRRHEEIIYYYSFTTVAGAMNRIIVVVGLCCVLGSLARHAVPNNMEMGNNMAGNMDLDAVMKTFDPKVHVPPTLWLIVQNNS